MSGVEEVLMNDSNRAVQEWLEQRFGILPHPSLDELVAAARQSPEPTGIDLTDDELDEFLAAIRR